MAALYLISLNNPRYQLEILPLRLLPPYQCMPHLVLPQKCQPPLNQKQICFNVEQEK